MMYEPEYRRGLAQHLKVHETQYHDESLTGAIALLPAVGKVFVRPAPKLKFHFVSR